MPHCKNIQCKGITATGKRCRRCGSSGSQYCSTHAPKTRPKLKRPRGGKLKPRPEKNQILGIIDELARIHYAVSTVMVDNRIPFQIKSVRSCPSCDMKFGTCHMRLRNGVNWPGIAYAEHIYIVHESTEYINMDCLRQLVQFQKDIWIEVLEMCTLEQVKLEGKIARIKKNIRDQWRMPT